VRELRPELAHARRQLRRVEEDLADALLGLQRVGQDAFGRL
jgi:hypothetical protein